jgi:hypothetical protein
MTEPLSFHRKNRIFCIPAAGQTRARFAERTEPITVFEGQPSDFFLLYVSK